MNNEQFKRKILRACWYDKYFYYLFAFALIIGCFYMLHEAYTNSEKYRIRHSYIFSLCTFYSFLLLGLYFMYKIPNRYKILTIQSTLPINQKRNIIALLQQSFGLYLKKNVDTWYYFEYEKGIIKSGYNIHINIDDNDFYVGIQSQTTGQGGFMDLGGTEKFRTKIIQALKDGITKTTT